MCRPIRHWDFHKFNTFRKGNKKFVEPKFSLKLLLTSVTRFGDLLHFGQLFKACGNNYIAKILLGIFL